MARSFAVTAVYLALAWVLMVSYQIFAPKALKTIASALAVSSAPLASMLSLGSNVVIFICSFAWIFVLSAAVSMLMFGRERRLSIQFLVSLALTATSSTLLALLYAAGIDLANPNFLSKFLSQPFTAVLSNPIFAFFYLALPFIAMIALDLRAVIKRK